MIDKAKQYSEARHIEIYIERHGLPAFLNSDNSVSFETCYTYQATGQTRAAYELVTVRSMDEARVALGY